MVSEFNNVELTGVIAEELTYSHSFKGEDFYTTKIVIDRESGNTDKLVLCISGRLVIDSSSIIDEKVYVKGQIRTYNYKDENAHIGLKTFIFVEQLNVLKDEDILLFNNSNVANLDGYICKKNNSRTTPFGRTICDCVLAVNRNYGKSDYIPCIFWGKNALYLDTLEVGDRVNLTGRFQSRDYTKGDEVRTAYEVSVQSFEMV